MLWGERRGQWHHRRSSESMERPMPQLNDLSRSLITLEQDATLIAVIEMGQSSWLVAGIVPGVERHPLKKLAVDESALLKLLNRWREEAEQAGHRIKRIAVAFEAGRDGFWLARWLRTRGIETHVIHASSVAVSREHRRAKTDRLDTELLKRAFLGWLRGERDRGWHRDGPHAGAGAVAAKHARPTGRSALCRPHWLARRERAEAPRERTGPFWQRSGSTRHDPIGVAISHVPEGQRLGTVVSSPHRECPRHSQDHDRGLGAQASDRPVAARAGRRGAGRRHSASRTMTGGRRRHPTVLAQPVHL